MYYFGHCWYSLRCVYMYRHPFECGLAFGVLHRLKKFWVRFEPSSEIWNYKNVGTLIGPRWQPIYLCLYCPFVGLWFFFSFLILCRVGRTPWTGDQPVARPLPVHTEQHTHKANAHRNPCLNPSVRAGEIILWLRPHGYFERLKYCQRSSMGGALTCHAKYNVYNEEPFRANTKMWGS
jgi:hypothetical protein